MRIRTIFIVGVPLLLLLGITWHYLVRPAPPTATRVTDTGYLSAIAPPTTLRPIHPVELEPPPPEEILSSGTEASAPMPIPTPKPNRWSVARGQQAQPEVADAQPPTAVAPEQPQQAEARPEASVAPDQGPSPTAEPEPTPEPAPPPVSASEPGPAPAPSEQTAARYRVRAGDTLTSIAAAHYGDASKWRLIVRANPQIDPRQIKVGQELTLPPVDAKAENQAGEPKDEVLATHQVGKGDSLYSLAKRYYGDGNRWRVIRDANPQLGRTGTPPLKLGAKLVIPAIDRQKSGD
jgi:nucleoid-associated protein YgaU